RSLLVGAQGNAKFSSKGDVIWFRNDSGGFHQAMTKTSDGGCAICGWKQDGRFVNNFYVIKYDSNGKKLWDKSVNVFAFSQGTATIEAIDGDLIVSGFVSDSITRI